MLFKTVINKICGFKLYDEKEGFEELEKSDNYIYEFPEPPNPDLETEIIEENEDSKNIKYRLETMERRLNILEVTVAVLKDKK